ncbi:hypothetical protein AVEN_107967-1 [Araneus ventricosus]|uniref:Uncharacterized protein n=1 Tax=Araneus ventricosus TaxID=182803 RepID=A0A4Y2R7Z2_ARAVE|nr:hypothetical protein AVEN_107967-1 [Araneus ventricosus]
MASGVARVSGAQQWRFSAQALEAVASCLENPDGLKIHSKHTVAQTGGELAAFGRGRESQNVLDGNCSAMPTAKLRHWVRKGASKTILRTS